MMQRVIYVLCLGIWRYAILVTFTFTGCSSECVFPEDLQSPLDEDGEPMPWQAKIWWVNLRHDPKLNEMQEMFVQRSHIWSRRQTRKLHNMPCERTNRRVQGRATSSKFGDCSNQLILYNRTCLSEQSHNHFKVIQYGTGSGPTFVCMKFVRRSDNVIQIMEGPERERNDDNLCLEHKMKLNEWPWIAPWRKKLISCPISGGFSFRTINRLTNEDFCEDEWRRSRLEIDCVSGDGIDFIAPKDSPCNPFSEKSEASKFYCWAGWKENKFTFLVVGREDGIPQYCLRFPRQLSSRFTVTVYFSVICPTREDDKPQTGIEYHEMEMRTVDSQKCVDDHVKHCHHGSRMGRCTNEEEFAIHCRHSCRLCNERPDDICAFSTTDMHGSWHFEDGFHKEIVRIDQTVIHFPSFGDFTCKKRSMDGELKYKTVMSFNNGCSRRFTCFEFHRQNNNVLQFRVGKSFRTDAHFETMCSFEDTTHPIMNTYRSKRMKNLILDGRLWDQSCGFSSSIPFNGTIFGEPCIGTVSDWYPDGCVPGGVLRLSSNTCKNLRKPMEYQCLALIDAQEPSPKHSLDEPFEKSSESSLEYFLLTKSKENGDFNCWVKTSYLCDDWDWKYTTLYKLDSPQCVSLAESACVLDNTPEALLNLRDDKKSKPCRTVFPPAKTTDTTHTSVIDKLPYSNTNPEDRSASPTVYTYGPVRQGAIGDSNAAILNTIAHTQIIALSLLVTSGTLVICWPT